MSDKVSHPEHYNYAEIECIDVIKAATSELTGVEAFCIGNAIKYLWRYKHKNGKEDLKKARWYLNYAISNSESSESGVAFGYPYNDSESVPACQTDCKYLNRGNNCSPCNHCVGVLIPPFSARENKTIPEGYHKFYDPIKGKENKNEN